jgi:hypothetical protein
MPVCNDPAKSRHSRSCRISAFPCQKDAPHVNNLFKRIENDPALKGKIKLLGVGAGNAEQYGILRTDATSERALFLIDKQGVIRYIDVHGINERPSL